MKHLPRQEQICRNSSNRNINFSLISVVKYLYLASGKGQRSHFIPLIQVWGHYLHLIIPAHLHLGFL